MSSSQPNTDDKMDSGGSPHFLLTSVESWRSLENLLKLAAQITGCQSAGVSIGYRQRLFFKTSQAQAMFEVPLEGSLHAATIASKDGVVSEDTFKGTLITIAPELTALKGTLLCASLSAGVFSSGFSVVIFTVDARPAKVTAQQLSGFKLVAAQLNRTIHDQLLLRQFSSGTDNAHLGDVLNKLSEAFVVLDTNWCYTFANTKAEEILNRPQGYLIGKNIWDEFPTGKNQPFHQIYHEAMATQEYRYLQEYYAPSDAWFENHIYPSPSGLSIHFRDITSQKRSEILLQQLEERFRLFMKHSPLQTWITDDDGTLVFANEAFLVAQQIDQSSIGKGLEEIFAPDAAKSMHHNNLEVIQAGAAQEFIESMPDGRGGTLYFKVHKFPFSTPAGKKIVGGMAQDITVKVIAEEKILASQALFRKLTLKVPAAIYQFEIAPDGKMTFPFMSEGINAILPDVDREQLKIDASTAFNTVHPDDIEGLLLSIEESRQNLAEWGHEYRSISQKNIVRWLKGNSNPELRKDGTVVWFGYLQDITDKKEAELRLTELNRELATQASKLTASNKELEQFAYSASHDLQEPLRMVTNFMQLLKNRYGPQLDPKAHEYIHFAVDGAERMRRLIQELLQYSRLNTTEAPFELVDTQKIVEDSISLFKPQMQDIGASYTLGHLPEIYGIKLQLASLFQNLLSNAIKFRNKSRSLAIHFGAEEKNGEWLFHVKDNGTGIEPQYLEPIFVVFKRFHAHDEAGGTGIGLAICKKIAEKHGGKIWVESQPALGSTFYFTIPKMSPS